MYDFTFSDWEVEDQTDEEDYGNYLHKVDTKDEDFDAVFIQTWMREGDVATRYTKIRIVEITELEGWPAG